MRQNVLCLFRWRPENIGERERQKDTRKYTTFWSSIIQIGAIKRKIVAPVNVKLGECDL